MDTQQRFKRRFSFEFFPPKTETGMEKLLATRDELASRQPDFFSVTYGAGGSTQERTIDTVCQLHRMGITTAPHISCIGSTRENLAGMLDTYRQAGIDRIVALRGDLPSGMGAPGAFRYANELVAFIREHSGDHFAIEVAAYPEYHPQSPSPEQDLAHFKAKVDAGASSAITQYFYSPEAYFNFVDRCEAAGLSLPIVPGIMPISNYSKLIRFSDACGAEIPRWIRLQLAAYGDDITSIQAFGTEIVTRLCEKLLAAGAPGLHFYTLNQAKPSLAVWDNLNISRDRIAF